MHERRGGRTNSWSERNTDLDLRPHAFDSSLSSTIEKGSGIEICDFNVLH